MEKKQNPIKWGCSSAGRAPALQAGGHGFESHHLHHLLSLKRKVSKETSNKKEAENLSVEESHTNHIGS